MPLKVKAKLLEPFYVKGVPIVPFLGPRSRVWFAVGDFDETGPLETPDDVARMAGLWQRKSHRLDQTPHVVNSENSTDSTALQQGADSA